MSNKKWFGKDVQWQLAIQQTADAAKEVNKLSALYSSDSSNAVPAPAPRKRGVTVHFDMVKSFLLRGETVSQLAERKPNIGYRDESARIFKRKIKATDYIRVNGFQG